MHIHKIETNNELICEDGSILSKLLAAIHCDSHYHRQRSFSGAKVSSNNKKHLGKIIISILGQKYRKMRFQEVFIFLAIKFSIAKPYEHGII